MTLRPRALLASAVVALALVATASPATAQDEVSIDHIQSNAGEADVVVSVDGVPRDTTFNTDTVGMLVDGEAVNPTISKVSDGTIERRTVLVLDASNSMGNQGKFESAVAAANTFLDTAPEDVEIGLVTFAGEIQQDIAPTSDRETIRTALGSIELSRGTNVFDAMARGLELLGPDGARSLLLLSDGADTNSKAAPEQIKSSARDDGVVIDVVSLSSSTKHTQVLSGIAETTQGKVIPADSEDLTRVFEDQAEALSAQLLVQFDVPEGVSGEAELEVTVLASDGKHYSDKALADLDGASALDNLQVVDNGKALIGKPVFFLGALALGAGLLGLLWIALSGPDANRSKAERRMDAYFSSDKPGDAKRKRQAASDVATLRAQAIAATERVVSRDLETRIAQRLTGAGSALTAAEWVLLHTAIAIGAVALGYFMAGPVMAVLGLLLGVALPWVYLKVRHDRRLAKFNGQLAETLGLMAGGLQAGLSMPQAVDAVVREGREPMAGELRRALVEQRLGVDITDALEGVGQRMESRDFGWIVMAVRIQREVGGNLAEILHTVADTLREREYLRRQVKALSAEGRLSGYILVGLPPVIFVYMLFVNREYVRLLYTTVPGFIMMGAAVVLLAVGSWAMAKLAQVEV